VLTHMGHRLEYAELVRRLPDGVEPGYDGLVLDIQDAA
jgi:phosphoribosyl 1,2-cyclic phosphate phosphodiesterase